MDETLLEQWRTHVLHRFGSENFVTYYGMSPVGKGLNKLCKNLHHKDIHVGFHKKEAKQLTRGSWKIY